MSRRLTMWLDELAPRHVAVAGYERPEMRAAMRWGRRHGAGVILMSETKWDDRPCRPWWKRAVVARWARLADAGLVSGAAATEYLVSLGIPRERVFRQYGAVDNAYFMREAKRSHCETLRPEGAPDGRYFLACSRLIESRKNIGRLLLAYEQYRAKCADEPWGLVICGDGQDRELLEGMVRDRGIAGVTFTGFQQVDKLVHWYAHAGCFVHPAINEAWGLVVNEAMAAGLPVLVSRRCGCAYDLMHDGVNGFSFDPYDTDELSGLLLRVAEADDDERSRMSAASQRIIANWGPGQFAAGLLRAIATIDRRRKLGVAETATPGLSRDRASHEGQTKVGVSRGRLGNALEPPAAEPTGDMGR